MKEGKCYYCAKSLPQAELKRCMQCLSVCYCSRECQKNAWVAGHKKSCMPHPKAGAEKDTPEWRELQTDKALTRWLDLWNSILCYFAVGALDLVSNPANYNGTHMMVIWITRREDAQKPSQSHRVLRGDIWPVERCNAEWPVLDLAPAKDIEPDRLRFIVVLEDKHARPLRARAVTARTKMVMFLRTIPNGASKAFSAHWREDLANIVEAGDLDTAIDEMRANEGTMAI